MYSVKISSLGVNGVELLPEVVTFIDSPSPEISWRIETDDPEFLQTGYRIIAKNTEGQCIWDSGVVADPNCKWIPWSGRKLASGEQVSLRLQVVDQNGTVSGFSDPARFEVGLLNNADWGDARWIWFDGNNYTTTAPSPYFRKEFEVGADLKRATLAITARGVFEASLDEKKIGCDLLTPGWTDFKRQIPFQTYDLTGDLPPGRHAIGAILADGWCCGNLTILRYRNVYHDHSELLARLELCYEDGRKEVIFTDRSWKASTGPILASDLYDGESYDARLEMPGWNLPGFDDANWRCACESESAPESPELVPKTAPPVRYMEELKPVRILHPKKDTYIWDFGQNFAGTFRIRFHAQRGRLYTFRTAEMLESDGSLYTLNYRSARSQDLYICGGPCEKKVEYIPKFTFHGFRYLQIDGFQFDNIKPEELEVAGLVMHSAMKLKGQFSCGNPLVTRLWQNALWGQRSNFLEIPTDCPQRDERLGWTGDTQIFAPTAMLNMDCCAFYRKYLRDIRDAVNKEGAAPAIAPAILNINAGAAGWGDAIVLIPYEIYKHYGWKSLLTENYDAMKRSVNWQKLHSENWIRPAEKNFGDWLALEPTPNELVATAYFAHCTRCLSEIAGILGKKEDEQQYARLAEQITEAFRSHFTDKNGVVSPPTQTSLVLALAFRLTASDKVAANLDRLEQSIADNGGRISTGFLGTGLILSVLERFEHHKTACDLMLQEEYPSWLFSVKQGATTIWERWNSFTLESGFGDVAMNSFNHYAYGTSAGFLISGIGGIHYTHDKLTLKIIPDTRFSPVRAVYDSPYGRIVSEWGATEKNGLSWQVEVPPGIPAEAVLPDGSVKTLSIGKNILL